MTLWLARALKEKGWKSGVRIGIDGEEIRPVETDQGAADGDRRHANGLLP